VKFEEFLEDIGIDSKDIIVNSDDICLAKHHDGYAFIINDSLLPDGYCGFLLKNNKVTRKIVKILYDDWIGSRLISTNQTGGILAETVNVSIKSV